MASAAGDEPERPGTHAEQCVQELAQNTKALSMEIMRLKHNLKKLHEFQCSLLVVCEQWMQWLERAGKLTPPRERGGASVNSREL